MTFILRCFQAYRARVDSVVGKGGRVTPKTRLSDHLKGICDLLMVEVARSAQTRDDWGLLVKRTAAARNPSEPCLIMKRAFGYIFVVLFRQSPDISLSEIVGENTFSPHIRRLA